MNRTLKLSIVMIAMMVILGGIAQASMLSEVIGFIFGRHQTFVTPGITYSVDEKLPAVWRDHVALDTRYWEGKTPVFQGTRLEIGVLIEGGTPSEREFRVYRTDKSKVVFASTARAKNAPDSDVGGMTLLGEFRGKYGFVILDTTTIEPGTIFLYTYVKKGRRYEQFGEQAVAIQIAPPLTVVIRALKDAPEETLKAWGLESYPTLNEVVGDQDLVPSNAFVIKFANSRAMLKVNRVAGAPRPGKVLGVFDTNSLMGIIKISEFDGQTAYCANEPPVFLWWMKGKENEIQLSWVVRVMKYADSRPKTALDVQQLRNLATYPDGPVGSPTFGLRNMMVEMATVSQGPIADASGRIILTDAVVHLRAPYAKNTSGMYQLAYQVWASQHEHWVPMPQEAYVPVARLREARVVRLAVGGIPVIKVNEANAETRYTPGIWGGLAYIIGQRGAKININNANNNANANDNNNANNNVVNDGSGTATGTATTTGGATAIADP